MDDKLEFLGRHKLVGIIRTSTADEAYRAAEAMIEGGVKIVEVTFSVPGAVSVIRKLRSHEGIMLGVGTTLSLDMAKEAIDAGAELIVSPHTDERIVRHCLGSGVLACPGAATATEVMRASEMGVHVVKIFPISNFGGVKYLKALRAPIADVRMMPTGGIDVTNISDYLDAGAFAVGVGGALCDRSAIAAGDYGKITEAARELASHVS